MITDEWIRESMPVHWGIARVKDHARVINGYPFDSKLFSADTGYPLVRIRDISSAETVVRYDGEWIQEAAIKTGDILVGMDGDFNVARWSGGEALLNQRVCCVRPTRNMDPGYLYYALPAPLRLINEFTYSTTVKHLSSFDVLDIRVPYPPFEQQELIANFLDRETARIDGLIAEKERMLALLEEKRAALISRVVTRGLDPNAPLKPSGQEWLGEIPAHWRVLRLKFAVSGIDQGSSPQCYSYPAEPSQWGVLKTGCVNGGRFREQENKALPDETEAFPDSEIHQGDVLMSRASGSVDLIGSVAHVAHQPAARLLLSDKIYRFRVRGEVVDSRFLVVAMSASYLRHQIKSIISGAEGLANNIAKSDIMEFLLVVPPVLEQELIVSHLDRAINGNEMLCRSLSESMALAKERRAALVTAAVTGQIPVEEMTG